MMFFKKIIFLFKFLPLDVLLFIKGVKIKIAKDKKELEQIYRFRKKIYLQANYIDDDTVPEIWSDEYDDYCVNIAAFKKQEIIGAVRLIPQKIGAFLPLERCFNIQNSLPEKCTEVSKIVIDANYRSGKRLIFLGLTKKAYFWSLKNKIEYWVAVMPEKLHDSLKKINIRFNKLELHPPTEKHIKERGAIKLKGYFEQNVIPYILTLTEVIHKYKKEI